MRSVTLGSVVPASRRRALALAIVLAAQCMFAMDQQIGGALGIAVITSIYTLNSVPGQAAAGMFAAFGAGAAIALTAGMVAWLALRGR